MQIETVDIQTLSIMPNSIVPITHTERDLDVVGHMLAEHGQRLPVLVQASTKRIFWGGDIWLAMKARGDNTIAAVFHDVDDEAAARIAVRLRRSTELQTWDEQALANLLAQWEDFDELGFSEDEFNELLSSITPVEAGTNDAADTGPAIPENLRALQAKWKTEAGQLWLIEGKSLPGRQHRLLIGDSANAEHVKRLMQGERATLFATDPPYAVDYTGDDRPGDSNGKDWSAVYQEASLTEEQSVALYRGFMRHAVDHAIKPNAAWYCWHASKRAAWLIGFWDEFGVLLHQQIIWRKTRPVLTRSTYLWQHEPCLYGWVQGHRAKVVEGMLGQNRTIWDAENPQGSVDNLHPTSKPTVLFEIPMQTHTEPGEICYEPFSGSGSQLVAGEKLGRLVYGIELSPYFVAGILERISGMGCEVRLA